MKIADISPVFKKRDNISKDNYQPISGLSNFIKRFEKILFSQLNDYMGSKFSKCFTGFRKNQNRQNCLLQIIESWKSRLNNGSKVDIIIMDLFKAFESLSHELLQAKLKASGLDNNSVTFKKSYLTDGISFFFQMCDLANYANEITYIHTIKAFHIS